MWSFTIGSARVSSLKQRSEQNLKKFYDIMMAMDG